MLEEYIYTFSKYLKDKFGERVHKLSLNAGFGCPNKNGTLSNKGCVFCNEEGFSFFKNNILPLDKQIQHSIKFAKSRFNAKKFIAYFQTGTNTLKDTKTMARAFDNIKKYKNIIGIFIGTRPDCIDEEKISFINTYTPDYFVCVELGMQTANNKSLEFLERNHNFESTAKAIEVIKKYPNIRTAAHIILGIPNEKQKEHNLTISKLNSLEFDFIKFHVFHILRNTTAHALYKNKTFSLPNREEYIKLLIYFLERIKKNTSIMRLVSTADKNVLVAPDWINDRNSFLYELERTIRQNNTFQGKIYNDSTSTKSCLCALHRKQQKSLINRERAFGFYRNRKKRYRKNNRESSG